MRRRGPRGVAHSDHRIGLGCCWKSGVARAPVGQPSTANVDIAWAPCIAGGGRRPGRTDQQAQDHASSSPARSRTASVTNGEQGTDPSVPHLPRPARAPKELAPYGIPQVAPASSGLIPRPVSMSNCDIAMRHKRVKGASEKSSAAQGFPRAAVTCQRSGWTQASEPRPSCWPAPPATMSLACSRASARSWS